MNAIGKAVGSVLATKAKKSITSWIGGTLVAAGTGAAIYPEVLEVIPEHWRGPAVMVVGAGVILARHRGEIIAAYAQLRAEINAAVVAAEKAQPPTDTH